MSALKIEYRPVDDLIPYASNARTHSAEQILQIVASIKEFGWTNPVLLDGENGIIAGHGRLEAARLLGRQDVPTITLNGLSDAQRRAYILADNKLALNAGWDDAVLRVELDGLVADGFDVDLIGFSDFELQALAGIDEAEAPDTAAGGAGSLAAKFLLPPFSVLNAREGWWQDRKRAWLALGIQSELGRGDEAPGGGGGGAWGHAGPSDKYKTGGQRRAAAQGQP